MVVYFAADGHYQIERFPETGFFLWYTADPGFDEIRYYPTREEALADLGDGEAREALADGSVYFDATPEGSIGNLGWGLYEASEMPEWMDRVAKESREPGWYFGEPNDDANPF